jgi:hypothetical protein
VKYAIVVDPAELPPNSELTNDGIADGIEDGRRLLMVEESGGVEVTVAVTGGVESGTTLLIPASIGVDVPGGSELTPLRSTEGPSSRAALITGANEESTTGAEPSEVGWTGEATGDIPVGESCALANTRKRVRIINRNANIALTRLVDIYKL